MQHAKLAFFQRLLVVVDNPLKIVAVLVIGVILMSAVSAIISL